MFYGIINKNKQFLFLDKDKHKLIDTLITQPELTTESIKEYIEEEVEQGYDGLYYLKGYASVEPISDIKKRKLREFYDYDLSYRKIATVEYDGKKFSISNDAKVNLMAVVQQAQIFGGTITYFEKNGNHAEYTLEEFLPIAGVISQGIAKAETSHYEKEAEILNAQTVEELEGITW